MSDEKDSPDEALAPLKEIDFGRESRLRYPARNVDVQWNVNETIHSVEPETAALQLALAKIDSDTRIAVADKQYAEPVRTATRPVWVSMAALTAGLIVAIAKDNYGLAVVCAAGLALKPLFDMIAKLIRKPD